MKKAGVLLIALVMLVTLSVPSFATYNPVVTIQTDTASAKVGDVISVGVVLSENSNLGAIQLELKYDSSTLEYVAGSASVDESIFTMSKMNDTKPDKIIYVGVTATSVTESGILLTAKFKVLKKGASISANVVEAVDADNTDITAGVQSGTNEINISDSGNIVSIQEGTSTVVQPNAAVGKTLSGESNTEIGADDGIDVPSQNSSVGAIVETTTNSAAADTADKAEKSNAFIYVIIAGAIILIAGVSVVLILKKQKKKAEK